MCRRLNPVKLGEPEQHTSVVYMACLWYNCMTILIKSMGDPDKPKRGSEGEKLQPDRVEVMQDSGAVCNVASGLKLRLNGVGALNIDGVSEEYRHALNVFLRDFATGDAYAQNIIGMVGAHSDYDDSILSLIRDVYEATGIDLMKEAFYQYWKQHGELPMFYKIEKGATFDLRCIYSDDPRLHSNTDSILGEYIDDWRSLSVTDEQKFWCEVAESTRNGLSPDVEDKLVEQFVERIRAMEEKPDVMTLIPSANPSKPFENYQMYPLATKVSQKTGLSFPASFIRRTKQMDRVEKFQGSDKYFGRRSLSDGVLEVDDGRVLDKTILLLDDGWSSGATLDSVKKVLYENGAKKVLSMHLIRC